MNRIMITLAVFVAAACASSVAQAQVYSYYMAPSIGGPAYSAPVYDAPITAYRPVVAAYPPVVPVTAYRPVVRAYYAPPVAAYYAPAPVAVAPVVPAYYGPVVAAPVYSRAVGFYSGYGGPEVRVAGQPVRNAVRTVVP